MLLSLVALFLTNLGVLVFTASGGDNLPGEVSFSVWVQSWRASWLDGLMKAVSVPGLTAVALPLVVFTCAFLYVKGLRRECALIFGVTVAASLLTTAIKWLVARPRPPEDLVHIFGDPGGFSFPSGHVMHYTVFLGLIIFVATKDMKAATGRRVLQGTFALSLLAIGASRIYLGAHWGGDIIAGYAFGAVLVAAAIVVRRRWLDGGDRSGATTAGVPMGAASSARDGVR